MCFKNKEIIKLNVGGISFHTYRKNLLNSSYFKNLLDGDMQHFTLVNKDEIFIDRCGAHFECILGFLRTGQVYCGANIHLEYLRGEAEYYQFNNLVETIEELIKNPKKRLIEYSFMDLSILIPQKTDEKNLKGPFQIINVIDVREAHNICWQHGGIYYDKTKCNHDPASQRNLYQMTSKLLVKRGI